ncbi:cellulase family glycosylhydrolase [Mycolicibacterium madagascariense]|uniref:cellulase family glycosylhydrolase n=1 Tax=Mycolicibacterium madagascariense TaxID=212765 RepID=UPI0013D6574F|nr:cellulase family glycosylhydrolase [Mycolicibacterium madagascariense]MCV7012269.1 cellulase family glycosylhydrolase [Mycolicibacterium madagascariense]
MTYDVMETAAIDTSSSTVGISDGDLYGKSQADIDKTLDELQATGVNTIRVLVPWAGVEPMPGVYDWSKVDAIVNAAASRNMAVLGVLNSTPYYATQSGTLPISGAPADPSQYADFAKLAATRYAGKISAYEIWNEPNSAQYFQTAGDAAAAYTALLKAGYTAIKAADPNAQVVGGVVGSVVDFGNITINPVTFIKNLYADGAEGYFDALSFHPYHFTTPFSEQSGIPNTPLEQLIAIRQLMIDNGDSNLRIWATEYGLPSAIGGEAQQAQFVSDFLNAWSKLSYAGPSFIYTTQDRPAGAADPEGTFGIFRIDWSAKPVQQIIKDFIAAHTPTTPPTDPTGPTNPTNPVDPGKAFAEAVAAFFQAVVKAYLNAFAQALANWGMSQQAAAPQLAAAKLAVEPAAADAIRDAASEQLTSSDTLNQVKAGLTAATDKGTDATTDEQSSTAAATTTKTAASTTTPDVSDAAVAVVDATAVGATATSTPATTDATTSDAAAADTTATASTKDDSTTPAKESTTPAGSASSAGTTSGATDTKPADTKPADTKPADTKPADGANESGTKAGGTTKASGTTKTGTTKTGDTATSGATGTSGTTDKPKSGKGDKDGAATKGADNGSTAGRHAADKGGDTASTKGTHHKELSAAAH